MMTVITVIGARPQFIKAAAVSNAFPKVGNVEEVLLHTGQHYDQNIFDFFFYEPGIPVPKYNLGVGGGAHGAMTGAQLAGIEEVLVKEGHDYVLVYGDTNSTLAGALAAVKLNILLAHVELATIHRAENTDDLSRLKVILQAFQKISKKMSIVWPIQPRTCEVLEQNGLKGLLGDKVLLIDPVGYLDMVMLEQSAALITTDSGGVQKEAFFYRVPCVTLCDETEWVEFVDAGWNRQVSPTDVGFLIDFALGAVGTQGVDIAPYGDGKASERIAQALVQ